MLPGNTELLESYLGVRRLEEHTKRGYYTAVVNWDLHSGVELAGAAGCDVERWYRNAVAAGNISSTIFTYAASRLKPLHVYALMRGGAKKRDAVADVGDIWDIVPFRDLSRESERRMAERDRDMVITREELMALLDGTHPRAQCYIALTVELANRKAETMSIRIKDIKFGDRYSTASVLGKTGERPLPIVYSLPYLKTWLAMHPDRRPEQYLFVSDFHGEVRRLSESTMGTTIRAICIRKKMRHIKPHMLRHTQLTHLAEAGLGEFQMKKFAGWTMNSKMPARYIHMSGRSHIPAVLVAQGIEVEKRDRPRPILDQGQCPRCGASIGAGLITCAECQYVLDPTFKGDKVSKIVEQPTNLADRIAAMEEVLSKLGRLEELKARLV